MKQADAHTAEGTQTILQRAATDPAFRARLLEDGAATLSDLGIPVPPGVTVKVVEDTSTLVHLVLPPVAAEELRAGELDRISGGGDNILDFTKELFKHVKDGIGRIEGHLKKTDA